MCMFIFYSICTYININVYNVYTYIVTTAIFTPEFGCPDIEARMESNNNANLLVDNPYRLREK